MVISLIYTFYKGMVSVKVNIKEETYYNRLNNISEEECNDNNKVMEYEDIET